MTNTDSTIGLSSIFYSLSLYDEENCSVDSIFYPYIAPPVRDVAFYPPAYLVFFANDLYTGAGNVFWASVDTADYVGGIYVTPDSTVTGMATAPDGLIYMAGEALTTIDITTYEMNYIGDLPPDMHCLGDITFRAGKLYLSSVSNTLVEVDIENPMNSSVVFAFPPDVPPIHGLVTMNYSCDSVITYAFGTDDVTQERKRYEVDFENQTLIEVCDSEPFVYGACSPLEVLPPSCDIYVDPDADDSSGQENYLYVSDSICVSPSPVTDEDVLVYSVFGVIDSVMISLTDIQDVGQEFLYASFVPPSLTVTGDSTASVVLINAGQAVYADFEEALAHLRYENTSSFFTPGFRQIYFRGFSGGYQGPLGQSKLPLFHSVLQLSYDLQDVSCNGSSDGLISVEPLGGVEPYELLWSTGATTEELTGLAAGTYTLEVSDAGGCENHFSFDVEQPDTLLVVIINYGFPYVCDSVGALTPWVLGGVPPYDYSWSNGWGDSLLQNVPPGLYELTVTDSLGCASSYSYELMSISYSSSYADTICEGMNYSFGDLVLTADTSVCQTFYSVEGCDSLVCLNLEVKDSSLQWVQAEICQGETYWFMGQWYDADTIVCEVFSAENGCDSTWCLSLDVVEDVSFVYDSLCPGDLYFFDGLWLGESGVYTDTLSNVMGCDSIVILHLTVFPAQEVDLEAEGLLCNDEEVLLTANSFIAYHWSDGSELPVLSVAVPGLYELSVEDEHGCVFEDSIEVLDHDFFIDAGSNLSLNLGEQAEVSIYASQPLNFLNWIPQTGVFCDFCPTTNLQPLVSTTYLITAQDSSGCIATDELFVEVKEGNIIYIPNAFSPNGDGLNDRFEVFPATAVNQVLRFAVYDRWGNRLFSTSSGNAAPLSWDGRGPDGRLAAEGVYTWLIILELVNGEKVVEKGDVLLMH